MLRDHFLVLMAASLCVKGFSVWDSRTNLKGWLLNSVCVSCAHARTHALAVYESTDACVRTWWGKSTDDCVGTWGVRVKQPV